MRAFRALPEVRREKRQALPWRKRSEARDPLRAPARAEASEELRVRLLREVRPASATAPSVDSEGRPGPRCRAVLRPDPALGSTDVKSGPRRVARKIW